MSHFKTVVEERRYWITLEYVGYKENAVIASGLVIMLRMLTACWEHLAFRLSWHYPLVM